MKQNEGNVEVFTTVYLGLISVLIGFLIPIFSSYSVQFSDDLVQSNFLILLILVLFGKLIALIGLKNKGELVKDKRRDLVEKKENFKHPFLYYLFNYYQVFSYGYVSFFFSSLMMPLFIK
jgi:hypothetical protein